MGRNRKKRQASGSPTAISKPLVKMSKQATSPGVIHEAIPTGDLDTPAWAVSLHNKMDALTSEVHAIRSDITTINSEISGLKNKQSTTENRVDVLEGTVHDLVIENKVLQKQILSLVGRTVRNENKIETDHEVILDLQCRSMRDNCIFSEIPNDGGNTNETADDVKQKVYDFIEKEAGIKNPHQSIKIIRAHRLGIFQTGKDRMVVAKFATSNDKQTLMSVKRKIKTLPVYDQFPDEVRERRRQLAPILVKEREGGKKASLVIDKLYVNGKQYHESHVKHPDIGELYQKDIKPETAKNLITDPHIYEGKKIEIKGSTFQCYATNAESTSHVRNILDHLYCNPIITRATHISYAYLIEDKSKSSDRKCIEYFNDDNEHGMGSRLLKQLKEDAMRNTVLICVRWAGINKLGPLRFKAAIDAAKDVLSNF